MHPGPCWHCKTHKHNVLGMCSQCGRFPSTAALAAYQEGSTNMSLETQQYVRKPFVVEAVEVTAENMEKVARWCGGQVRSDKQKGEFTDLTYDVLHIKVKVKRALNDRQTKAFVGDWVLKAGTGFKVYTAQAFANSFEKVLDENEGLDLGDGKDALLELLDAIEDRLVSVEDVKAFLKKEGQPTLELVKDPEPKEIERPDITVLLNNEAGVTTHPAVPDFVAAIEKDAPTDG